MDQRSSIFGRFPFKKRKKRPDEPDDATTLETEEEERYRPIQWPLVKRLLVSLKPFKRLYIIGILLGLMFILLDMSGNIFIKHIIDYAANFVLGKKPNVSVHGASWHIVDIIAIWAGFVIASIILQRASLLLLTRAGESVQFIFREQIFAKLQQLSMSYYDKTKLGRIISRCTSDIKSLREVNVWGIWQVFANGMQMIVAASFILYFDWRLFLSLIWLAVALYFLSSRYHHRSANVWQVVREGFTRVSTNLAENITGMRVVTAFNRQDPNLDVFNRLQTLNTANNMVAARINGLYQPLLEVIRFCGRVIILLYGGYTIATGNPRLSIGTVVAIYGFWDWFMNPVINLGVFYNQMLMAMAGAERVFAMLDLQPDVQDLPDAAPLPRIDGHVQFENVIFGYNPDKPVLHGINFDARPGQLIALVGSTGSGKSSIISLIARFYQPQSGRILVDGNDIRHVTGESLHHQMGLVLQVNYLFTGSVLENICYAKPSATREEVIAAAKSIGSHESIESLSKGYDSDVGERGANMSLGQRQLICFTRPAFLADPRIFMLDEATSAVDTGTELTIQNSLEKLLAGRTTFVVAHRLSTIMRADVILVIDHGHIIERGTHKELVSAGGRYAHLYEQFAHQQE